MRTTVIIAILYFHVCGCSHRGGRPFDGLLASNRIDRIEIVDDDLRVSLASREH
jgi:hypothetical protein